MTKLLAHPPRSLARQDEMTPLEYGLAAAFVAMALVAAIPGLAAALRREGVAFLDTPDTYYELLPSRLPGTDEDFARMQKNRILMDGSPSGGRLLQIFTNTVIGPIFFELIQRKGDQGFGEGNFRALFESIELDQVRRGVLKPAAE